MRRIHLGLTLLAILFLAACSQADPLSAGFGQQDLALTVGGTVYRCDDNIEDVVDHMGTDYDYAEGMSCDYDGLDKTYTYDVATFYTNPIGEGDLINEIYTQSASVTTSRGIAVGSKREEVLAAYGDPAEDAGDLLIYSLPGERASLCFEMEDGAVWAIYLTTQPV